MNGRSDEGLCQSLVSYFMDLSNKCLFPNFFYRLFSQSFLMQNFKMFITHAMLVGN